MVQPFASVENPLPSVAETCLSTVSFRHIEIDVVQNPSRPCVGDGFCFVMGGGFHRFQ